MEEKQEKHPYKLIILSDEIDRIEKIRQCGMLGYTARKICALLKIENIADFLFEFGNEYSEIRKAYDLGKMQAEVEIDWQLFTEAKDGDLPSMEFMEQKKELENQNELRKKLFGI